MASYYKIGEGGWDDVTIELYELAEYQPAVRNFRIYDEVHSIAKTDEFHPHHIPASVQLTIQDVDGYYYDKMEGKPGKTFMLKCTEDSTVYFQGYVINPAIPQTFLKYYDKLTLVANDGIKSLDLEENTYTDKTQLGSLLYNLLDDVGFDFDLNVLFTLAHQGASGYSNNRIQQVRVDPSYYLADLESPTKYDLLTRILADFKLQLFQEEGAWWLMQRDARTDVAALIWTYDGNSWSDDPVTVQKTIATSDLRSRDDNSKSRFPALHSVERIIQMPKLDFAFENPLFAFWTSGEADGWEGTGEITQLSSPSRLQFDALTAVRSQSVKRHVVGGDTFHLYAKADYTRESGLADGVYTVGFGHIKAVSTNGEDDLYLKEDGSWTTMATELSRTFSVLSSILSPYQALEVDVETDALPHGFIGYIEATLQVTGDTSAIEDGASPVYEYFYVEPVEVSSQVTKLGYLALLSAPNGGDTPTETVYADDLNYYRAFPAHYYYNGSGWYPASDWSGDASNQSLAEIVLTSYLKSASVPVKRLQLRLPFNYSIRVRQTILFDWAGATLKFVPVGYYRYRKARQIIVHLAELQSSGTVVINSRYIPD